MFDIITFGSAVVDIFVNTDLPEENGKISYCAGSKILIKDLKQDIGGGGTNTAVAFARLGLKTGYIGKFGNDENGKNVLDMLKREKVIFLGKQEKNKLSGCSIILDSREHERTILTYKGINNDLAFSELNLNKIKTKWIYYSSLEGESFKTQEALAKSLTSKGIKFAFNPSEYQIKNDNLKPLLKICEILILNKEEAEILIEKNGKTKDNILEKLHELGPKIVVVTNKDELIWCYDGKKKYSLKPHKVKAVERTGAGDAFASGFVAGQIIKKDINFSLNLGLKEAESVIRYFGAKNILLTMNLKEI